jgi:ketosteroid isomerase-like protein
MDDQVIRSITGAYAAFASGDLDVADLPLHPDVAWSEPTWFPFGGARRGPAEVADYLARSRAGWAQLTSTPLEVLVSDTKVAVLVEHEGVRATGEAARSTVLEVFVVVDGVVVAMEAFGRPPGSR